jgi:UDP-N-acetylmuramyl tripeptide synthase
MNFRSKTAIRVAKLTSKLIKKMNRGSGVTLPGYVACLIDPRILTTLSTMVTEDIFVVMGTNGKTTANAILYEALDRDGHKVISNRTGANMLNGIVSAFVLATNKDCTLSANYACIEVDEMASVRVLPLLKPDYAILTNIARDQIDRFGEVEVTYQKIKSAFDSTPDTTLVINCDDPLSYSLTRECNNPIITYGITENVFKDGSIKEEVFCPLCSSKDYNQGCNPLSFNSKVSSDDKCNTNVKCESSSVRKPPILEYEFIHYGQLGIYHCLTCDFKRPNPEFTATNITRTNEAYSFKIDDLEVNSTASATYNIYNTLSAMAVLKSSKAKVPNLKQSIEGFDYGNNRESIFILDDARIQLHLAKNPVGFQQKISLMIKDNNPKDVIFLINDTYQDGEDVSWLWDVDFAQLLKANITKLFCGGVRQYDVGLRLKYEEIPCYFVEPLETTIKLLLTSGSKNIYIVMNYSNLYPTNALLTRLVKGEHS